MACIVHIHREPPCRVYAARPRARLETTSLLMSIFIPPRHVCSFSSATTAVVPLAGLLAGLLWVIYPVRNANNCPFRLCLARAVPASAGETSPQLMCMSARPLSPLPSSVLSFRCVPLRCVLRALVYLRGRVGSRVVGGAGRKSACSTTDAS